MSADRRTVAAFARQVLAGGCSFADFARLASDAGDADVERLVDLLEHEPAVGGKCGVGSLAHQQHRAKIAHAIQILDPNR